MPRIFNSKNGRSSGGAKTQLEAVELKRFLGLNLIDNDRNISHEYAVELQNLFRDSDDNLTARFGTNYLGTTNGVIAGSIMDMHYYQGVLMLVDDAGEVASMTGAGVATARWNATIGNALPGAPGGWGAGGYDSVDFVDFKSQLVVHNGVDKPIIFDSDLSVDYLQDPATGSNVNTPIGLYGTVVGNYHVIAGVSAAPTTIYISSKGTSGVFPGDPAPNDSIALDIGAYVTQEGDAIRGVQGFRNYLLVYFRTSTVVFQLGTYESTVHVPTYVDTIANFGLTGHRLITPIQNDVLAGDITGLATARRNLFSQTVETKEVSQLIANGKRDRASPSWQGTFGNLTDAQLLQDTWAVHDKLNGYVQFFAPGGVCFTFVTDAELKRRSWSTYSYATAWTCGCATEAGRVFFAQGQRVFKKGNNAFSGENYYADRLNDRDADWANATAYVADDLIRDTVTSETYKCLVNHTSAASGTFALDRLAFPTYWELYKGETIDIVWEMPWQEAGNPAYLKQMHYAGAITLGNAVFDLKFYVDHLYKDVEGDIVHDPALTLAFVGGEAFGLGEEGEQLFGGGRRSDHPKLWKAPAKFKAFKWRVTGSIRKQISFASIVMLYRRGLFKRS